MSFIHPGYPHLSYSQIEEVWIKAGGQKSFAPLMAAIAMAESGGWAGNTNPTDNGGTQTSWGLWQISNGTHGSPVSGDIYDPETNAKAAIAKINSQGLSAWGTYTSGAYRQYLRGNIPPGTGPLPSGPGSPAKLKPEGPGGPQLIGGFTFENNAQSVLNTVAGLEGDAYGMATKGINSVLDALSAIARALGSMASIFTALLWFANPANQLRIWSGVLGLIIISVALYFVATS
jgi:hypothetical protein